MAASASQFKKMFPEFSDAVNSGLNIYLSLAEKCIGTSKFGNKRDEAVMLLAAHMYSKVGAAGSGSATGAITKEKVGDLEVTYSTANASNTSQAGADYQTTPYGQLYWNLLRGCIITPMVSGC